MKIGVVCPHRNDRPKFLAQFKKYLAYQTLQPDVVEFVDYAPESEEIDITQRYRRGYEKISPLVDVVLFMEVDDWYSKDYVETMIKGWNNSDRPDLIAVSQSIYYHISGKFFRIDRPSANTFLLRSRLNINWGKDNYPYIDVTLWSQIICKVSFFTSSPICVGIKHGIGLVGGGCHNSDNERYTENDLEGTWLKSIVGNENFEFYKSLKSKL